MIPRLLLAFFLVALAVGRLLAQSTFGEILGTVRDSSGAVVQGAQVTLANTGTTATRAAVTDANGSYAFKNIDVGAYTLTITAPGFEKESLPAISLTARETRRMDATLKPGAETQTVVVLEDAAPVITTDVSSLAETKIGDELVELPVAIYSRSTGSTSPISTLTTEAGVQTDDSGNLAVDGTTAALLSVTIDGISSVGVEYSGPVNEMFPSFNSIEEIRVSESNNSAEFGGVADITTVSKAGTNHFHGGVFENHENTVFNSNNTFALAKPKIIMNDFGGTLGGPLRLPRLFNGNDNTFFFISFEGLRLPRETPIVLSVPSMDMRSGYIGAYLDQTYCEPDPASQCPNGYTVYNPDGSVLTSTLTNTPVTPTAITTKLLNVLMPTPNYGVAGSFANNYQINFPSPISSNQGDVRLDRTLSSRQSVFARFSYKNRQVITAPSAACTFTYCAEAGSPLQGAYNTPEIDEGLTFAHNYVFSTKLLNEFRGGYNAQHTSETQSYATSDILSQTGLTVPQPDTGWSEAPQVLINGFMSTGAGNPGMQRGQIIQALDNLSWSPGKHSFKFGADFKRITDHDDNVFGNYRSGWYVFDGSSGVVAGTAGAGAPSGEPYAGFLLGYPDYTEVSSTNDPTMNGLGYSYAFFGQDDWKVTPHLTLNLGLRYELHPPIRETNYNTATFLPDLQRSGHDPWLNRCRRRRRLQCTGQVAGVFRPAGRYLAHAHHHRRRGRHSRGAAIHRPYRLGSAPGLCLAALRQRQDRPARRLGTLHRSPAGFRAGLRLGRPLQLCGHLQPGIERHNAAALLCRSFQQRRRRKRSGNRGILLRLPHPLSRPHRAAVEPDPRTGLRPQPSARASLTPPAMDRILTPWWT